MEIPFVKMHGLGNSYIFLDLFQYCIEEQYVSSLAIAVADANTGIGSDGLILIHPSEQADVGMRIFNKDGSEGKNCGNGLRCVAKYAFENKLVEKETFLIETRASNVTAQIHNNGNEVEEVTIDMGTPTLNRKDIPMLGDNNPAIVSEAFQLGNHPLQLTAVSMGNPHAVFFVENIAEAPLYELGPIITDDQRFPEGVNVEFIEVISTNEINFRVWERGSGVTQACGTGACAAVVAAVLNDYVKKDTDIVVHLIGGDLTIHWSNNGRVRMRGKAETTVKGTFFWNQKI